MYETKTSVSRDQDKDQLLWQWDQKSVLELKTLKGTKPWQQVAVRLFVLYNNERNSPSFQPILSNFKDIVIYLKNLLTFEYRQNSLIPLYNGGCVWHNCNLSTRMAYFFMRLRLNTSVDHVERGRMSHSSWWMCYCTLINQFITLEQRKSLRNLQTTNHR